MAPLSRIFSVLALILGVIYYRSGEVIKNSILVKSTFPKGYILGGDFDVDCKDIGSSETPEIASCEDIAFWDLHDSSGKLKERRLVLGCDPNRHNWNTVMGPLRDPNPRATLWLYTEPPASTQSTASAPFPPTRAGGKAASILDKIRGTVNKKQTEEAPSKPLITVSKPDIRKLELKNYPEGHDFHPLGIEIWPSYGGNGSYLYAVNHARYRTVIEQFLLDPTDLDSATHIRTITHSWFISPNALTLTSPNSFYVSNDHLFTRRLPILGKFVPIIETFLGLPFSFVSHVTLNPPSTTTPVISEHTIEAPFIPFSNGVSLSPGGTELAVASTSLNQILFYNRDPTTNKLAFKSSVPLPFCPDNIRYYVPESHSENNTLELIVAGHPHFPSLVRMAENKPGAVGQSWIVSITQNQSSSSNETNYDTQAPISANEKVPYGDLPEGYSIETIFQSNGTGFSGSTTGLKDSRNGYIYASGLYAPKGAMVCRPGKST